MSRDAAVYALADEDEGDAWADLDAVLAAAQSGPVLDALRGAIAAARWGVRSGVTAGDREAALCGALGVLVLALHGVSRFGTQERD